MVNPNVLKSAGLDPEEIEPAKVIYLGQDIEDFIRVAAEDDQTIKIGRAHV